MATKVIMPKVGLTMTEGVVVKWLKEDGAPVTKKEPIAVIMSKKISYELEASTSGIFHQVVKLNQIIPINEPIAWITAPGEPVPAEREEAAQVVGGSTTPPTASPAGAQFVVASPAARRVAKELNIDITRVQGTGPDGKITEADVHRFAEQTSQSVEVSATSAARKLAEQLGVDLALVSGTGPGGRITEQDVQDFYAPAEAPAAAPTKAPTRIIPFYGMREMIAQHMTESLRSTAQVTANTEVDVTEMVKMREQIKTKFDLTYNDILIKAVTLALKEHPLLNATLVGNEIHLLEDMNIGVAVALEDGLIVPVVHNADRKSLGEIAQETRRLAEAARKGSLTDNDVSGGTFTITNLGMYGIDTSTPILNLPEVAILGAGRIITKPAVYQDEIVKRALMGLSLTFDHRIVDGAPAAAFLRTLSGLLEKPYLLFV